MIRLPAYPKGNLRLYCYRFDTPIHLRFLFGFSKHVIISLGVTTVHASLLSFLVLLWLSLTKIKSTESPELITTNGEVEENKVASDKLVLGPCLPLTHGQGRTQPALIAISAMLRWKSFTDTDCVTSQQSQKQLQRQCVNTCNSKQRQTIAN